MKYLRELGLLVSAVMIAGCTTLGEPVEVEETASGDLLVVTLKTGDTLRFELVGVGTDTIHGITPEGDPVRVNVDQIAKLRVDSVDPVRTGAAVAGGFMGAMYVVGILSILSAFGVF